MGSSSLFFDSAYVDLQCDEIYLSFTAGSVSLSCVCSCDVAAFGLSMSFVMVPYMDAVVAVTVMRVLLFCVAYVYTEIV